MHTTITREAFVKQLELVGRVSTKHITLPILQCVHIEVTEDSLVLKATNLEIGIESKLAANTKEVGVVAVPAATLIQTVTLGSEKEITLRTENDSLIVEGSGSETTIKAFPHDEFPNIPKVEGSEQELQGQLFAHGIKTSAFAASQSSIKPELGSVYILQKKEHTLTFVATDSFRLMEKTVSQKGLVLEESILIPQKNALELARICETIDSNPKLRVNDNQCALVFGEDTYVTSRLTSGSFPDYNAIIPKEYVTHATLLRSDLTHAFKKTNIFLNKFFQVGMHITDKNVTVSANSGEVGTTTESVSATVEGDELTLNFNQRYVGESLQHISDESVVMHFAGIGRPMVLEGVNDKNLRYLVMPMNK